MATARNTTTPDSADLHITVTDAADYGEARAAAEALMATSRYTKDAKIISITKDFTGDFSVWAEF